MILNIAAPGLSWGQIVCSDHWSVLQSSKPKQLKLLLKTTSPCFHSSVHWTVKSLVKCCRPLELIIIFDVVFYCDSALMSVAAVVCSGVLQSHSRDMSVGHVSIVTRVTRDQWPALVALQQSVWSHISLVNPNHLCQSATTSSQDERHTQIWRTSSRSVL